MIEAVQMSGVAFAMRDPRSHGRGPRAVSRRGVRPGDAERVEIGDALAAIDLADDEPATPATANGATVTAAAIARRLVAGATRAVAAQARLGPAAVRRLVGADG